MDEDEDECIQFDLDSQRSKFTILLLDGHQLRLYPPEANQDLAGGNTQEVCNFGVKRRGPETTGRSIDFAIALSIPKKIH